MFGFYGSYNENVMETKMIIEMRMVIRREFNENNNTIIMFV